MSSEIIEARSHHAGQMARILRHAHRDLLVGLGINVHRELRRMLDASMFRHAYYVDGKLMAVGGVTGTTTSTEGMIWIAISEAARARPHRIARMVLGQLEEAMVTKRRLATIVFEDDKDAIDFARFLGFITKEAIDFRGAKARVMQIDRSMREVA